ncbi:MAG: hypothetical protein L6Q37_04065 [Bdellovibrionaceae bacterium]|nr:hypothetical protein [Pseudobdellovibrionaceae bacterium]
MDSAEFTYWKLVTMIHYIAEKSLFLLNQAAFAPIIAKLFGAKIGKNVAIGGKIDSPYFIELEDNVVLGHGTLISGNYIQHDKLHLGKVKIKRNSTIGVYSVVFPNTIIEEDVSVAIGSMVNPGTHIPAGETWKGNPARKWN